MVCYSDGRSPIDYLKSENIDVESDRMTSPLCILPYEYYALPFLRPTNGTLLYDGGILHRMLHGYRIVKTPYKVRMLENIGCKLISNTTHKQLAWDLDESNKVIDGIQREYFNHLYVSVLIWM